MENQWEWQPSREWTIGERLRLIGRISERATARNAHTIENLADLDLIYRLVYEDANFLEVKRQNYKIYFA